MKNRQAIIGHKRQAHDAYSGGGVRDRSMRWRLSPDNARSRLRGLKRKEGE